MFQVVLDLIIVGAVFYGVLSGIFWVKNKLAPSAENVSEDKESESSVCCGKCHAKKSEKEA
jgi:cytochrome c553